MNVNKNYTIALLFLILVISCKENTSRSEETISYGDTTPGVNSKDETIESVPKLTTVENIKKEFSYISSIIGSGKTDSTSFKYDCNGEKNGTVTYYNENGKLRMIKHSYNEYSHFSATDKYYVKEDSLFFVFYEHLVWSFTGQQRTKDDITEKRFYIINNNPVQCLEKKYTILSADNDVPKSNEVANKEIQCTSLAPVLKDFKILLKYQNKERDINCL